MCNCKQCVLTIEVNATSANITLTNVQRIRNNRVTSIAMRRVGSGTAKGQTGKTLVSDAVVATAYLSLKNANGTEVWGGPMQYLQRDFNAPDWMCVSWSEIDPEQSTIVFDTTVSGFATTQIFEISFGIDCENC